MVRPMDGQGVERNTLVTRNVRIDGRRTCLRLEQEMWHALEEICVRERLTLHALCSLIEPRRFGSARATAVRAFVVAYFRFLAATGGGSGDSIAIGEPESQVTTEVSRAVVEALGVGP